MSQTLSPRRGGPPALVQPAGFAVELRGLRKSFGPVRALDGIDLTVAPGEVVAVLGPNGAGKSTTTELILGLTAPDGGSVSVFGHEPAVAVRAGLVGAMLQAGALLGGEARVIDLLELMHGLHARPLPLADVIERAQVTGFLRTRTDKLSGGQAQRVRFALAIMPDPSLLILDEPTVGMDVEIRREFWRAMHEVADTGRTVLFATHYLDEADLMADRIVVLRDGQIVADGTAAQIKGLVAGRVVSVAADSIEADVLAGLPAVVHTQVAGVRIFAHTTDSDVTVRALLATVPDARDLEITSTQLEDAFLALTTKD